METSFSSICRFTFHPIFQCKARVFGVCRITPCKIGHSTAAGGSECLRIHSQGGLGKLGALFQDPNDFAK